MYKAALLLIVFLTGTSLAITLNKAQEQLLSNNLEIQAIRLNLEKAKVSVKESRAALYPSLDASASYRHLTEKGEATVPFNNPFTGKPVGTITTAPQDNTEFGIDLSYPFFLGLSRLHSINAAEEGIESARASLVSTKNRLSLQLGILYSRWLFSYKQLEVRRIFVDQLQLQAEQTVNLFSAGVISRATLLQTQSRLQSAKTDLLAALDQTDSLKRETLDLIQIADTSIQPSDTLFAFDTVSIPSMVDTARPEIVHLNSSIRQIDFTKKAIRGQRMQSLAGSVGYRYANPGLNPTGDAFMGYGVAGIQAKWNLFDGFRNSAQRAQLDRQVQILDVNRKSMLDAWKKMLELSTAQVARTDERIKAGELALEAARELENELRNAMDAGTATRTDYINAMGGRVQAELLLEQVRFTKRIAVLNALYAAGKELRF